MELRELFDENNLPTGEVVGRGKEPEGRYYRISGIFVLDERKRLLATRRAKEKASYPLWWEFTCGGHLVGEDPEDAARRELSEEVGLAPESLRFLGSLKEWDKFSYLYLTEVRDATLSFQEEEVCDATWLSLSDLEEKLEEEFFAPPMKRRIEAMWDVLSEAMR